MTNSTLSSAYVPVAGPTATSNHAVNPVRTGVTVLALDENSDDIVNLTVAGSLAITASALDRSLTKMITLNLYAGAATHLEWPVGTIWADNSEPVITLIAGDHLTATLLLGNGLVMAARVCKHWVAPPSVGNMFLAVGNGGAVVYGNDPANFNVTTILSNRSLTAVDYRQSDGMIVALYHTEQQLAYGMDPSNLTVLNPVPGQSGFISIACRQSDGMFVIGGSSSEYLYGVDPSNFTKKSLQSPAQARNMICRQSDGMFVLTGQAGRLTYGVDPENFSTIIVGKSNQMTLTYRQSDGMIVICGGNWVVYGTNPANMTAMQAPLVCQSLACRESDGMFVGVGGKTIFYGTDPSNFTIVPYALDPIYSVACRQSDGMFVITSVYGEIFYGIDPSNLTTLTLATDSLLSVTCGPDGTFVAVGGKGDIVFGTDPAHFRTANVGTGSLRHIISCEPYV